jgi:hypothetical protein
MEKIQSIKEITDIHEDWMPPYRVMDGWEVETDKHRYRIMIDNGQDCCECWGYICSNDETERFIGKELVGVFLTDTALNKEKINEMVGDLDDGGIQFVDFICTDGDKLQLAVYNAHNGYYGHAITFERDGEILLDSGL